MSKSINFLLDRIEALKGEKVTISGIENLKIKVENKGLEDKKVSFLGMEKVDLKLNEADSEATREIKAILSEIQFRNNLYSALDLDVQFEEVKKIHPEIMYKILIKEGKFTLIEEIKEVKRFYEKEWKKEPSASEVKKIRAMEETINKFIANTRKICREESTFDGIEGSEILTKLTITSEYLDNLPPSTFRDAFIHRKMHGFLGINPMELYLSSEELNHAYSYLSPEELANEQTKLNNYLIKNQKEQNSAIYREAIGKLVAVRKELYIREEIDKKIEECLGIKVKELFQNTQFTKNFKVKESEYKGNKKQASEVLQVTNGPNDNKDKGHDSFELAPSQLEMEKLKQEIEDELKQINKGLAELTDDIYQLEKSKTTKTEGQKQKFTQLRQNSHQKQENKSLATLEKTI